jgi:hypothetical protein
LSGAFVAHNQTSNETSRIRHDLRKKIRKSQAAEFCDQKRGHDPEVLDVRQLRIGVVAYPVSIEILTQGFPK